MVGALLALHAVVWGVFCMTRMLVRVERREGAATAQSDHHAPGGLSNAVLALHAIAFVLLYGAIFVDGSDTLFTPQLALGAAVILAGMALMVWTISSFHSWRLAARIEDGHQLATHGPFHLIRHPIYCGLDLLALGSALWMPTNLVWLGFLAVLLSGDVRSRVEEKLLVRAFGQDYEDYCRRTKRLIPGIY
jgi:protein-S-isoprenylcysteine O-methyltransferase Ste14